MSLLEALVIALLLTFPRWQGYLESHADVVTEIHDAAVAEGLPPALLLAVCSVESRLGASLHPHRLCGVLHAPREEQARIAARSLVRRHANCGSWPGALRMFNSGSCAREATPGYAASVMRVWRSLDAHMPDVVCEH